MADSDGVAAAILFYALETHELAKHSGSIRDRIAAQQNVLAMLAALGFEPSARARMRDHSSGVSKLEQLRAKATLGEKTR